MTFARWKSIVCLLVLMVGILAVNRIVGTAKAVTLEYTAWDQDHPTFFWFEDVFDEFEKTHPDVKIKITGIPSAQYREVTMMNLAAGQMPDLYPFLSSMLMPLYDAGFLESLDPWLSESELRHRLLPLVQEVGEIEGHLYGLLRAAGPWMPHANMRLLRKAGINTLPTTIEEFYTTAKKVKEATGEWGYLAALDPATVLRTWRTAMIWSLGFGTDFAEDGKITVDVPEMREAFRWLRKMVADGVIPLGIREKELLQMFWEGKVGMVIGGTWYAAFVHEENPELYPDIELGKVPFPSKNSLTGGGWVGIPTGAKHKDLAWELLETLYSSKNQIKWCETSGRLGSTTDQPTQEWINENAPWWGTMLDVMENHTVQLGYAPPGFEAYEAEFQSIFIAYMMRIVTGKISVEEGLKQAQEELETWAEKKGISQ